MNPIASTDHDAALRLFIAWAGAVIGSITLQQAVLGLTGIYTLLQLYVLIRDKLLHRED